MHDRSIFYGKSLTVTQKDAIVNVVRTSAGNCRPRQVQDVVSSSQVIIMISCLHFKLCVTKIIRLPDGGYMRVQVHINPDCTQAVASLVRRERDSVREELGGGSNMKGSSFSELNRVLELRSLKDSTGHLNTNTMYCIKSKVSSVDGKQTVWEMQSWTTLFVLGRCRAGPPCSSQV